MMDNLQALTIIWHALHDYRETYFYLSSLHNNISEGSESNDPAWDEITHAMAIIHESLEVNPEDT